MQPNKTTVIGLFNAQFQYQIPIFQRGYVWTLEKQVGPLWQDIQDRAEALIERRTLEAGGTGSVGMQPFQKHFLGSIVMAPVRHTFGRVPAYEVIDGQQRSTTLQLLLLAFRRAASQLEKSTIPQMLAGLTRNVGYDQPEDHFKVWPTQAGQDEIRRLSDELLTIEALCSAYPARDGRRKVERPLMVQTFLYLYHACLAYMRGLDLGDAVDPTNERTQSDALVAQIRGSNEVRPIEPERPLDPVRAETLYMVLSDHIQIMTLALEAEDDPQVIFETLNARGEPLLASDLIRNFVFLEAARNQRPVQDLYRRFWSAFDLETSPSAVSANRYWRERERQGRLTYPRVDLFFFNYTVLRSQEVTLASHVFHAFKASWQRSEPRNLEAELARIVASSNHFKELISPEGTGYLAEFARLVRALDVGTVTPVYLALRERLAVDSVELKQALGDLASYLTRRAVCGLTTKGYNRFFLRVLHAVTAAAQTPHVALREVLLSASAASEAWPDDAAFKDKWLHRPAYTELKPGKTCAVLRALEYAARGKLQASNHVPAQADLTVEHVMPQSWEKLPHWQMPDMTDDQRLLRETAIHCFGNLTVLTQPLNSTVSNGPFLDPKIPVDGERLGKRSMLGQSALLLNTYFQKSELNVWNEDAMTKRAKALFEAALLVWKRPADVAVSPVTVAQALYGHRSEQAVEA